MEPKSQDKDEGKESVNNVSKSESLIELRKIKETLSNCIKNKSEFTNFTNIYQNIFKILYENNEKNPKLINKIVTLIEKYLLLNIDKNSEQLLEIMEKIMMLLIFHFNMEINKIGFELLKYLIEHLEMSYSNELLSYFIELIKILNLKNSINPKSSPSSIITSIILYNISLAIYIILSNSQIYKENKKNFINFIKKNLNDLNLIFLLFLPYDNNFTLNIRYFENDDIIFIYEKLGNTLIKTFNELSSEINTKKQKGPSTIILCEKVNLIGIICKILNSLTEEGGRTYSLDNLVKNMIEPLQKILASFNEIMELKIVGLLFNIESIKYIFEYCQKIRVFNNENLIKAFSFSNRMYLNYPCEYLNISFHLVEEINKLVSIENNSKRINFLVKIIMQIIDIIIQKNNKDNKIQISIYELIKLNQMHSLIINYNNEIESFQKTYPNAYEYIKNKEKNNYELEKGFSENNEKYLFKIYNDCISEGDKIYNFKENKNIDKNIFMNCLNKFEEFKNSIKDSLGIKGKSEIEQKIEKEKNEINQKDNVSFEDFEEFFLKNSMDMFQELFKN